MKLGLVFLMLTACGGEVAASDGYCEPLDAGPCFSGWTELPNAQRCYGGAQLPASCENVSAMFGEDGDSAPTYWCCP